MRSATMGKESVTALLRRTVRQLGRSDTCVYAAASSNRTAPRIHDAAAIWGVTQARRVLVVEEWFCLRDERCEHSAQRRREEPERGVGDFLQQQTKAIKEWCSLSEFLASSI